MKKSKQPLSWIDLTMNGLITIIIVVFLIIIGTLLLPVSTGIKVSTSISSGTATIIALYSALSGPVANLRREQEKSHAKVSVEGYL